MAYSAAAVANEFLERAAADGVDLTQIGLQKLVYFAHGWHLAWTGEPLILELIEAWEYGPVARSLYSQFRRFGSSKITDSALEFSVNSLGEPRTTVAKITDNTAKSIVGAVWKHYGRLPPFKLVELTHAPGSPWDEARRGRGGILDNDSIKRYFEGLAQEPREH